MWLSALSFLAIAVSQRDFSARAMFKSLRRLPDLFAVTFLLWAIVRCFSSFDLSAPERGMAMGELSRIGCGVLLFLGVRHAVRTSRQIHNIWLMIFLFASLDSIAGIITVNSARHVAASASYFNKQQLAAFLVGLVPFTLASVFAGPTRIIRRGGLFTFIILLTGFILTGNRTSWVAAVVGTLGVAVFISRERLHGFKPKTLIFSTVGVAVIAIAVWLTGAAGMIRQRFAAESFKTFTYRYPLWHAAAVMIREHPLMGIGIGQYPPHAFVASGYDTGIPTMQSVLRTGPTLWSLAHSEYLQTAAEIGAIGLFLYLATLFSFVGIAFRAAVRMAAGPRRIFLIGCFWAVIAQCIDALANPGWRFIDVDPILWLVLGLGMATIPRSFSDRAPLWKGDASSRERLPAVS